MLVYLAWLLLWPAAAAAAANCTFYPGRDYADPAGPVLNATSAQQCCDLCLKSDECAVSVFAAPSAVAGAGVGKCYTKTSGKIPIEKGPAARVVGCATPSSEVSDKFYDCRFRQLAMAFTEEVVLGSWPSASRAADARAAVANGLRMSQCPAARAEPAAEGDEDEKEARSRRLAAAPPHVLLHQQAAGAIRLFMAADGDDSAAGTAEAPLLSISGAQARIRKLHPTVATRPAITVVLRKGDYYMPGGATFAGADSGSSAAAPIVYAAELDPTTGQPTEVTIHGGLLLSNLSWSRGRRPLHLPQGAGGGGGNVWQTRLPPSVGVDSQDQLYLGGRPLVRARIPNGRCGPGPLHVLDGHAPPQNDSRRPAPVAPSPPLRILKGVASSRLAHAGRGCPSTGSI
eukprot:SAG22_NODE_2382_length_2632_cov_1.309514_1_plen_400_part_00